MTGKDESILMSIPMLDSIFPQLTNQQFINCAFLERTLALVSAYCAKPNTTRVSLIYIILSVHPQNSARVTSSNLEFLKQLIVNRF